MNGRRSLWAERDRRTEADEGAFSAARWHAASRRPRDPDPPDATEGAPLDAAPRSGRGRWAIAAFVVALLALGVGVASLLTDGDAQSGGVAALPEAPGGRPSDTDARRVYDAAGPGVVSIRVQSGSSQGSGTGFVVAGDGTIVTNAHVVSDADTVHVRFDDKGALIDAEVIGRDPSTDLAVVRVDPDDAPHALHPLPLADSDAVRVGDRAIAIGHPFGLERTATAGIVSGTGREIQAPNGFEIDNAIQTDAPINPGNSGGPLLDAKGRVIGVNSQIRGAGSNGNVGIGFAVPSNTVKEVLPKLRRGQRVPHPWLGVSTAPLGALGGGAQVAEVVGGSPADRAGIRAGDRVLEVDDHDVHTPEDVVGAVAAGEPGDEIELVIERDGERRTLRVELGNRPERLP